MTRARTLRALSLVTLSLYAALIAAVWLAPVATINEVADDLPATLEASSLTYRGVATVLLAAGGALVALVGWTWSTRPSRPFALPDGGSLTVAAAARLLRQAVVRRSDVRAAEVFVEHRAGSVAARITLDVTADALLADIEEHTRGATRALAARVNSPLADLELDITFDELNLVAARDRRRAARSRDQLRAA